MSTKPFLIGSKQPLMKGFVLTYAVLRAPSCRRATPSARRRGAVARYYQESGG